MVSALANSGQPAELPCLVDQASCGEVYYITWTKQQQPTSALLNAIQAASQPQSQLNYLHPTATPGQLNSTMIQQPAYLNINQNQQQNQWTRVYLFTGSNDSLAHKPIGELANRAQFIMPEPATGDTSASTNTHSNNTSPMQINNVAKLVIEEPRQSDEATYKCDVTYVRGKCPSISLVRLQMLQLPQKARIFNRMTSNSHSHPSGSENRAKGVELADGQLVGPLNERQQLRLSCLVAGGRPQPKLIIWRKVDPQGRIVNLHHSTHMRAAGTPTPAATHAHPAHSLHGGSNELELDLNHTLSGADLGARFECHVEHEGLDLLAAAARGQARDEAASSLGAAGNNDALLDLHPSQNNDENRGVWAGGVEPRRQLDAHVLLDLNVAASSLELFMSKINSSPSQRGGVAGADQPMKEGELVELECVAYAARPAANISWFNGNELIESSASGSGQFHESSDAKQRHKRLLQRQQVHKNTDQLTYNTQSHLSIKLSRYENGAQITCRAQNSAMDDPIVKTLVLQVQRKYTNSQPLSPYRLSLYPALIITTADIDSLTIMEP